MARVIWGVVAVLVAIWVFFALLRFVSAFIHLALIVAVVLVAFNLVRAWRNQGKDAA